MSRLKKKSAFKTKEGVRLKQKEGVRLKQNKKGLKQKINK